MNTQKNEENIPGNYHRKSYALPLAAVALVAGLAAPKLNRTIDNFTGKFYSTQLAMNIRNTQAAGINRYLIKTKKELNRFFNVEMRSPDYINNFTTPFDVCYTALFDVEEIIDLNQKTFKVSLGDYKRHADAIIKQVALECISKDLPPTKKVKINLLCATQKAVDYENNTGKQTSSNIRQTIYKECLAPSPSQIQIYNEIKQRNCEEGIAKAKGQNESTTPKKVIEATLAKLEICLGEGQEKERAALFNKRFFSDIELPIANELPGVNVSKREIYEEKSNLNAIIDGINASLKTQKRVKFSQNR